MPGLTRLLEMSETAGQTANFCSSMLLQWVGDRWSEFHFDPGTANADRQRLISLRQSTTDYSLQKQLLDQYHQKYGVDLRVSEVLVFQRQDRQRSVVRVAVVASAAGDTLVPEVERLSFVRQTIDPKTGAVRKDAQDDIADATWSEAMDIVGHLFEPVAYLYPPRVRAVGFPDADAWAKLKALRGEFELG